MWKSRKPQLKLQQTCFKSWEMKQNDFTAGQNLIWFEFEKKFILFSFTIGKLFTPISVCDASGWTATLFIPIKSTTMTGNEQLTCTTARNGLLEVWTNFVWLYIKLSPYCMLLQQDRLGIKTYVEIAQASFVTLCFKTAGCFWDILFS